MKKTIIVLSIVLALLVVAGLVTSYADSARVRNSVEPVHTIKIVSADGTKVTYWGLGYKVIRYPSVSPNEPYKNNRGIKYGNWFMKYELPEDNVGSSKTPELEVTVSYANWGDLSQIYTKALNTDKMMISSVRHLPIYKFDTLVELQQFKNEVEEVLSIDQRYDEVVSFNEATAKYDEAFFEENTLMLVYVEASSGSCRYGVREVYNADGYFCIHIEQTNNPEVHTDDMAGWFVTVAVSDESVADCTVFDADFQW